MGGPHERRIEPHAQQRRGFFHRIHQGANLAITSWLDPQPVRQAVNDRGLFTAGWFGWFGVREK